MNNKNLKTMLSYKFKGWWHANNFDTHPGKRILLLWNSNSVRVEVLEVKEQYVHCLVTCLETGQTSTKEFLFSVLKFYTKKRYLKITKFNTRCILALN